MQRRESAGGALVDEQYRDAIRGDTGEGVELLLFFLPRSDEIWVAKIDKFNDGEIDVRQVEEQKPSEGGNLYERTQDFFLRKNDARVEG